MKFSDLDWTLVPMESPAPKPKPLPLALVHAKSGAKMLRLGKTTREALRNPNYVQIVANHDWLAIRSAAKGDQHARPVSTTGAIPAVELIRMFQVEPGSRMTLVGALDEGHVMAPMPRAVKGGTS